MKKARVILALMLVLLSTTLVVSADPPPPPHPGPAMFDPAEWCWIIDAEWNWYYLEHCSPQIGVITNSRTGVILWTAKAQLPAGAVLPEKGAHVYNYENSGFECWWDDNTVTTNFRIVITPEGSFTATCLFMPGKWQP
jgi:hypothetical protein